MHKHSVMGQSGELGMENRGWVHHKAFIKHMADIMPLQ